MARVDFEFHVILRFFIVFKQILHAIDNARYIIYIIIKKFLVEYFGIFIFLINLYPFKHHCRKKEKKVRSEF